MTPLQALFSVCIFSACTLSLRFTPEYAGFNLNENQSATDPLDYSGQWPNHTYHLSPKNWRMPTYTLFLDRFVNGNPSNDNANNTQFEHDLLSNQLRNGGDIQGLQDTLDYLQGMGIKTVYLAGSPLINQPWASDGYSPLDLTLLDAHFGDIAAWRDAITDIHARGMYVLIDNTFGTLGDLLGSDGHFNTSTVFSSGEYDASYKSDRIYHDFAPGNSKLASCEYPRFWGPDGYQLTNLTSFFDGCRDSEFDQYGDLETPGNTQIYELQLLKFASVQDRLRDWRSDVLSKIQHFSCLMISMLDVDGFRIDKATQVTLDSQAAWSSSIRQCARLYNKENFLIAGEVSTSNAFGSIYIGRGIEPEMAINNLTLAVSTTNETDRAYIRDNDLSALDAAAFHYTVYRALERFLGLDGIFEANGDPPTEFVSIWTTLLQTNDLVNANTGEFDPRHMLGSSNQDTFRWPAITDGIERQLLAHFIVSLLLPGTPTLYYGEEQAFYLLENMKDNYLFGRQPMSSSLAWQLHGCYKVGASGFNNFPLQSALDGCTDDSVSLDHRDPSHPVRNIIKRMFEMRETYSVLNDGYYLQLLSNQTREIQLPGSNNVPTETGLWSVYRSAWPGVQTLATNQSVWLLYTNENQSVEHAFDCNSNGSLVAPFDAGTIVKNLFPPFEEYTLSEGFAQLGLEGSTKHNGCLPKLHMPAWGFKALVPKTSFVSPGPVLTSFSPGHDARIASAADIGEKIHIQIGFSDAMNCEALLTDMMVESTTESSLGATIDPATFQCSSVASTPTDLVGSVMTTFVLDADLLNVHHGIHRITVNNAVNIAGVFTNSVDHFMIRVGGFDNPIVFPSTANYSSSILQEADDTLTVSHKAAGADMWRYSLNFGTTYGSWQTYSGSNSTIQPQAWSGTKLQSWDGQHVIVQYWSQMAGSSDHYVHGDVGSSSRRFPNMFLEGSFNQFGADTGVTNRMILRDGKWEIDFMAEWPASFSLNSWGINPDGKLDATQVFGDIDGDHVLDRIPPQTLLSNVLNISIVPPSPHLAYRIELNDGNLRYELVPTGSQWIQVIMFILLALIPVLSAILAVLAYMGAFYQVKFNQFGAGKVGSFIPGFFREKFGHSVHLPFSSNPNKGKYVMIERPQSRAPSPMPSPNLPSTGLGMIETRPTAVITGGKRKKVLIATMEYDIEDWNIKVKIGGLGVMAQLMGKSLGHQDLVWVVPCCGGIDYPEAPEELTEPMEVTILGQQYSVDVRLHVLRNITYVLLDAPIFRKQTKSEPYPPRMDDLDSAVYYSAWNSCIAEAIKRYKPDLYHINDYHGAVAPLHLLPNTIPCALSLHNAEFQGLWPMRNEEESAEVCKIYNLDPEVVKKYVQFGEVFNLLHAATSYLRIHQDGFGAVGVSKKYGKRSYARYPIFWGLKEIGSLPNPDPSDTAEWHREDKNTAPKDAPVDQKFEAGRAELRADAQKWAGLNVDPSGELFVFVGRWSQQKGIDLIADIFPSILEKHPKIQLICVGPTIDLYGKFAALKLAKLMEVYPGRVFSKPEFTALPPYIFSGAEFALIPSRDEPFGLVAVEFGRKGALGVGARVGGLGTCPGWWYTVESTSNRHLLHQFQKAIEEAMACPHKTRAQLRARAAKLRFPVAEWVEDLETLQSECVKKHQKYSGGRQTSSSFPLVIPRGRSDSSISISGSSASTSRSQTPTKGLDSSPAMINVSGAFKLSRMGSVRGPGHDIRVVTRRASLESVTSADGDVLGDEMQREEAFGSRGRLRFLESERWKEGQQPAELSVIPPTPIDRHRLSGAFSAPQPVQPEEKSLLRLPSSRSRSRSRSPDGSFYQHRSESSLSLNAVVGGQMDFELQKVSSSFTDMNEDYTKAFQQLISGLNAKNSDETCIEEYIEKSEKDWHKRYREKKLGKAGNPESRIFRYSDNASSFRSSLHSSIDGFENDSDVEFLLQRDYMAPTGIKKLMLRSIGDWPVYSLLLALGQIIAASSYQITLLTGDIGESAEQIYIISSIYLVTSILWWLIYRMLKSIYVLSCPFIFYGLAFLLVGISSIIQGRDARTWIINVATGCYAVASASGSIYFSLNFGNQGGAPVKTWIFRACVLQGTQQIYTSALWLWGSTLSMLATGGVSSSNLIITKPAVLLPVGAAIAVLLWLVGLALFLGLPDYYRQAPGTIPSFIATVCRRKIILWFFMTVVIQNFFLSAPYGRNWLYLWSSQHLAAWQTGLLAAAFFVLIWAGLLFLLNHISQIQGAWLLPIFAIGLGAPRWAQMLWATSGIGLYIPWAGGAVGSAIAGRCLWLWLGVLDALQGVGFGMILLQTLTRFHIAFTLMTAQVIGSAATIIARGVAPDNVGHGPIFPNFGLVGLQGLMNGWFWGGLTTQLLVSAVAIIFFRKEQLSKP